MVFCCSHISRSEQRHIRTTDSVRGEFAHIIPLISNSCESGKTQRNTKSVRETESIEQCVRIVDPAAPRQGR